MGMCPAREIVELESLPNRLITPVTDLFNGVEEVANKFGTN